MTALTIGMATYNDFNGVYFTIQALRHYQDLEDVELVVVDTYGCEATRAFVTGLAAARYIGAPEHAGTAAAKERVLREARGDATLCCDAHVIFAPGVIARLKAYHRDHPTCPDLLQGPLLSDGGFRRFTHLDPVWRKQFWGTWAADPRGADLAGEPFEIQMQGLGAFSCRTAAWPGFNPRFRGYGGEEGYLHEKFRRAGGRCLCLPWFCWLHRSQRPDGIPYPFTAEDKLRNYLIGHAELGLDLRPPLDHFAAYLPAARLIAITAEAILEDAAPDPGS